jgi:hypothetical protein
MKIAPLLKRIGWRATGGESNSRSWVPLAIAEWGENYLDGSGHSLAGRRVVHLRIQANLDDGERYKAGAAL